MELTSVMPSENDKRDNKTIKININVLSSKMLFEIVITVILINSCYRDLFSNAITSLPDTLFANQKIMCIL